MMLYMMKIAACAQTLSSAQHDLGEGVTVSLSGTRFELFHNRVLVFHMKVQITKPTLVLDYPNTAAGEDGRGWARLGLFIALLYGRTKQCNKVGLGTLIESTQEAHSIWAAAGIASQGADLNASLVRVTTWISNNMEQPLPGVNSIFEIRPKRTIPAAAAAHSTRLEVGPLKARSHEV